MTKEEYVNNVTLFSFSLFGFTGINEVSLYKDAETGRHYMREKSFGIYTFKDNEITEISEKKWNSFFDELFGKCQVMKYERNYIDDRILDGLQWKMRIEFANRRAKISEGYNLFPDNWDTLIDTVRLVSKEFGQ